SVGKHIIESVSCVPGKKEGDQLPSCDHRRMPHIVTGRRHHKNPAVLGDRMGCKERTHRWTIKLNQLGTKQNRPPLRETARHLSFQSSGFFPTFAWCNDFRVRKMMKPSSVVMMIVGEDHSGNIPPRIKPNFAKSRANLLMGSHPNADLLGEERIPPRKITRGRVLCTIPCIHDEAAFWVLDHPGKDFQRADPILVAKNVNLTLKRVTFCTAAFLSRFHPCFASGNWSDFDHISRTR